MIMSLCISIGHYMHTAHGCRVVTEAGNQQSKPLVRALWQRPGQTVHDEVFRLLQSWLDSAAQWKTDCYIKRTVQNPIFFPEGCSIVTIIITTIMMIILEGASAARPAAAERGRSEARAPARLMIIVVMIII